MEENKADKVVAELIPGSWERALRAARNTVWKKATHTEPSDKFKKELCMSEHSPLRLVEYYIHIPKIKYWMTPHFTRHKIGVEWFQSSLRDDRVPTGHYDRDTSPQGNFVSLDCQMNAAELIFMARRRLCRMAHVETRAMMYKILDAVKEVDPIVVDFCVPNCVYRGVCPEAFSCGYTDTDGYATTKNDYIFNALA